MTKHSNLSLWRSFLFKPPQGLKPFLLKLCYCAHIMYVWKLRECMPQGICGGQWPSLWGWFSPPFLSMVEIMLQAYTARTFTSRSILLAFCFSLMRSVLLSSQDESWTLDPPALASQAGLQVYVSLSLIQICVFMWMLCTCVCMDVYACMCSGQRATSKAIP